MALPINQIENKKYIAKNRYYRDQQPVNIPKNEYNTKYDAYYTNNSTLRKYLDDLLNKFAPGIDKYNFANSPIYIPIGEYTGGIPSPNSTATSIAMHQTEQYMLKISNVSTNVAENEQHAQCVQVN
jgi:hypothetical protein